MVLLVAVDGDIVEVGRDEMSTEFVGGVGMHTIDNLLPLLVGIGEAVILVYDDEAASYFQCATYTGKALLYLRPEINRLEGGDKVKRAIGKG